MIIKEIEISGEKFRLMLTEQIINQVNNLKTLYSAAYDDPESFEQVSAEISAIIQEISRAVEPKPNDSHLDNLIQQVIKTVDDKNQEIDQQSKNKPIITKTKKGKKKNKKQAKYGGSERNRTAVQGFAGPYITTLPPSQFLSDN